MNKICGQSTSVMHFRKKTKKNQTQCKVGYCVHFLQMIELSRREIKTYLSIMCKIKLDRKCLVTQTWYDNIISWLVHQLWMI